MSAMVGKYVKLAPHRNAATETKLIAWWGMLRAREKPAAWLSLSPMASARRSRWRAKHPQK